MIGRAAGSVLDWYGSRRRRQLEEVWRDPVAVQERALRRLTATARDTEFGLAHGFRGIRSVTEYQARVPVRDYGQLRPWLERAAAGEESVAWPGRCRDWVKTSGTTAGDKVIPVTPEAFTAHKKGGWDALLRAASLAGGGESLMGGPMLFLGGSTTLRPLGEGTQVGDLSGLVASRLPWGFRGRYSPGPACAAIANWEERLDAISEVASTQDVRLLSGMPSWLVILFERIARRAEITGGRRLRSLGQLWPHLRVLIHGGVAFAPYAGVFEEWLGRPLPRVEVYPASEGFVGVQTEAAGGLTLMLDYGIFYEFVPVEDLGAEAPRRHTVAEIELGRPYAVVMSTPAGLWSYALGDTVRFTGRDPLRLVITGRTRHYVNAFGENVIVEEVERALVRACRRTEAEVVEFTVAPRWPGAGEPRGGHEWLVEFRVPPTEPDDFARILDEALATLNTDYRTKRSGSVGMVAPTVTALPTGSFHRWMRKAGRLGDQHKVARVTNDRTIANELLVESGLAADGSVARRHRAVANT
ncbi:MAG TPA: GH3 auxin-responsive promoter family protein [Candidatus Limnocylindria bacterium]|nr:GH3 auxin-responsive promoter family protein [Candidatus Limnocylindria bacterium]